MDCMHVLEVMVKEASDYNNKALQEVNKTMHHEDMTMVLKGIEPQTQAEARMKEIDKITKQHTYTEIYLDATVKTISGKWVDTGKFQERRRSDGAHEALRRWRRRMTVTQRRPTWSQ